MLTGLIFGRAFSARSRGAPKASVLGVPAGWGEELVAGCEEPAVGGAGGKEW